jgi:hypothetical protein
MQNVAPTYYVFADKSIAMDSGLEHISLPRESQLRIPHISATDLEHHLQTMRMLNPYLYPGTQKSNIKKKERKKVYLLIVISFVIVIKITMPKMTP